MRWGADELTKVVPRQLPLGGAKLIPAGLGRQKDELVILSHAVGDSREIVELAGVEHIVELDVGAPDPPVVGQAQRPVAPVLLALPAADDVAAVLGELVAGGAEQAVESVEAVIPVVVAGDGEDVASRGSWRLRQRQRVGGEGALVVSFARGPRIDLIAAEEAAGGHAAALARWAAP